MPFLLIWTSKDQLRNIYFWICFSKISEFFCWLVLKLFYCQKPNCVSCGRIPAVPLRGGCMYFAVKVAERLIWWEFVSAPGCIFTADSPRCLLFMQCKSPTAMMEIPVESLFVCIWAEHLAWPAVWLLGGGWSLLCWYGVEAGSTSGSFSPTVPLQFSLPPQAEISQHLLICKTN